MGKGQRLGAGGRRDWPVILAGMAGAGISGSIALFVLKPLIELPLWLGTITFCGMIIVGAILGHLAGRLLLLRISGGPSEDKRGHPEQPANNG